MAGLDADILEATLDAIREFCDRQLPVERQLQPNAALKKEGLLEVDASGKMTHEWSEKSFDRMIEVNLKGVWLSMKRSGPVIQP